MKFRGLVHVVQGRLGQKNKARLAREAGDWAMSEALYRSLLQRNFRQPGLHLQLGHTLKAAGRFAEAEAAYRTAIAQRPSYAHAYLQLGLFLQEQGRTREAEDIFAQAIRMEPGFTPVRDKLIAIGARHRLPEVDYGRSAATDVAGRISANLTAAAEEVGRYAVVSSYPARAYDAFAKAYPVGPPPAGGRDLADLTVLVDAADGSPSKLRRTLTSLLDQRDGAWRAIVRGDVCLFEHSVTSYQAFESRIQYQSADQAIIAQVMQASAILQVSSGLVLDREAVGWVRLALASTTQAAVIFDQDQFREHWRDGMERFDPALFPRQDVLEVETCPIVPAAVAVKPALYPELCAGLGQEGSQLRRSLLMQASRGSGVANVPRILFSVPADQVRLENNTSGGTDLAAVPEEPITVIIPTRDRAHLLQAAVLSLVRKASNRRRLSFIVIDNGSSEPRSKRLFDRLRTRFGVKILASPGAFNWPLLNNLAADMCQDGILVFANNDVEMTTQGWDEVLRSNFSRRETGIVGARLLFPRGAVQHAGIVLGAGDGRPVHEGEGADATDPGPLGRWRRRRTAAAVTGAFMAVRQTVFNAVGRFDPRFSIAYNDIDFCLAVRRAGLEVVYDPAVELVHHESATRGRNDNREKVAWDDDELRDMHRKWGAMLTSDPTVNLQWSSAMGRPYEGFRDISSRRVLDHLAQSGSA